MTFDNCYTDSLPCMSARRELHTGRYNFLHRGWSPLGLFDDSMPQMLDEAGIHTRLISDHVHYSEDEEATYYNRYTIWENVRGQEGDRWKCDLTNTALPDTAIPIGDPAMRKFKEHSQKQDVINRSYMPASDNSNQTRVFQGGLEFIDTNHSADHGLLQIECFDPHEPFFTFEEYLKIYDIPDIGKQWD